MVDVLPAGTILIKPRRPAETAANSSIGSPPGEVFPSCSLGKRCTRKSSTSSMRLRGERRV